MAAVATADLAGRHRELVEARAGLDREIAALEAQMGLARSGKAQDGHGDPFASEVTLKQAAHAWGITTAGARLRAIRLETAGLARKARPGGWRVSEAAIDSLR